MSQPDAPETVDPVDELVRRYEAAAAAGAHEPEAMSLATATRDGRPSLRMVLFRGLSHGGLTFFTNYESRKGVELVGNPHAAAMFYWHQTGVQVRVEGTVERLSEQESDAYFEARPRGHRLGAWASPQSRPIAYADLLARYEQLERTYEGLPVPRPTHWGGFRLVPHSIEFWLRRDNRLHERIVYERTPAGWQRTQIGP